VIFTAARHTNRRTDLGSDRVAPCECDTSNRTLRIEADRVYFDARGKSLIEADTADPKRAETFREDNGHLDPLTFTR
jgi:hypothetical protein